MRVALTTLTIALLYGLISIISSSVNRTLSDVVYSFITFSSYSLIFVFLSVLIFHFLLNIFKWTKRDPALIFRILTLGLILYTPVILIHLPDYVRHQNDPTYIPYSSLVAYFKKNMLEGVITATCLSIAIPILDVFFQNKILKFKHPEHKK